MTWIDFSYKPPSPQEKAEVWKNLNENTKKMHSLEELNFPKYNAQKIWANWHTIQKKYVGSKFRIIPNSDLTVYFINVDLFLRRVSENQDLFNEILGPITGTELLNCICEEKSETWQKFKSSHTLNGILLGYGITNAIGFEKRTKGNTSPDSYLYPEEENLALFAEQPTLKDLSLPGFRIFENGETMGREYESERSLILEKLRDKNRYKEIARHLKKHSQTDQKL